MPSATFSCRHILSQNLIESPVSPGIGMCVSAWEEELAKNIDKNIILNGLRNGFDIIDESASPHPVKYDNHPSARQGSPFKWRLLSTF